MSLPVSKNLSIYQGDSYELKFTLYEKDINGEPGDPIDLTGAVATAEIRATAESGTVLAEFDGSHNSTGGTVTLVLSPAETAALPATGGVWDVQIEYTDGEVRTYLAGNVAVTKEVTRA
jgi:hypothetical protein